MSLKVFDEKLLAVGNDSGLRLIDVASGKLSTWDDTNAFLAVAFSSDGKLLVVVGHAGISIWNVATAKKQEAVEIQRDTFRTKAAFSADGSIAAIAVTNTKLTVCEIPAMKSKK